MTIVPTKPRIRGKAEPIPAHFFAVPEAAPTCYGETKTRTIACLFSDCGFADRCGDFIDRAESDRARGTAPGIGARFRVVVPAKAPIVVDEFRFRARIASATLGRHTPGERMLASAVDRPETAREASVALRAEEAHLGGLLSARVAAEIADCGTGFCRWLLAQRWYGSRPGYAYSAGLVWVTAEIARQALRNQGRPDALFSKAHHDLWRALLTSDLQISRNALRKRRQRVKRLYGRFESAVRSSM